VWHGQPQKRQAAEDGRSCRHDQAEIAIRTRPGLIDRAMSFGDDAHPD
jgi:hypothetical protein